MRVKLSGAQVFRMHRGRAVRSVLRWWLGENSFIYFGFRAGGFFEIFSRRFVHRPVPRALRGAVTLCFSKGPFVILGPLSLRSDRFRVSSV